MVKKLLKKIVFTLVMLCIMTSTVSLAWQDVSQYKTGTFKTSNVANNVVLIEDYQHKENWNVGDSIVKKIAVRNGQDNDDNGEKTFENAYVRLQFKEFLETRKNQSQYSKQRYMVDENNEFITFNTLERAKVFVEDPLNKVPSDANIEQVKAYPQISAAPKNGYFYIASRLKNANGHYGKFLTVGNVEGDYESIEGAEGPQKGNSGIDHSQNANVAETSWSIHKWDKNTGGDYAKASIFTQYIKWNLGADVILFDQWDGKPTAKWIIDNQSDQGWVYWGQALEHSSVAQVSKTLTTNVLESVELKEQPGAGARYFINVKMDAVNRDDLKIWDDAPRKILEAFKP